MTTDAGSGSDDQAASRDAAADLDELEEESSHLAGDEAAEEEQERQRVHDEVNDAF